MKKIMVINGPNLNMLGIREPEHYGKQTYSYLVEKITRHATEREVEIVCKQSNHEGDLVDYIQSAYNVCDGIIINPGAYTHTSIAIYDAVKAVSLPCVEVHISDVDSREEFRRISYIRAACIATVSGHGIDGYCEALDILLNYTSARKVNI